MKKYDVFISHAYADQSGFSNELAFVLKNAGLRIWYSGFELQQEVLIGESLRRALREVHFGILIISPVYLQLPWAIRQLNVLQQLKQCRKNLLTVFLGIDPETAAIHFRMAHTGLFVNSADASALIQQLLEIILTHKHIAAQTGCITLRDMPAAASVTNKLHPPPSRNQ